jgi:hypothetical protein
VSTPGTAGAFAGVPIEPNSAASPSSAFGLSSGRAISLSSVATGVARIQAYAEKVGGNLRFVARSYFPAVGAHRQRENAQSLAEIHRCLRTLPMTTNTVSR